jgi:hypothetical protein
VRLQEDLVLEGEPERVADILFAVATVLINDLYGQRPPDLMN